MDVDRVLAVAVDVIRPCVLDAGFTVDSCVVTTRVAIDALQYFGVVGKPVAVEVIAFNERAAALAQEVGVEEMARITRQYASEEPGGPWTVGVGMQGDGLRPHEAGHVVVGVPSAGCLLDLSLDQVSRPHKDMRLAPMRVDVPDLTWFTTVGALTDAHVPQEDGTVAVLAYRHAPERSYRRSPNWGRVSAGDRSVIPALTATVIRALRARRNS